MDGLIAALSCFVFSFYGGNSNTDGLIAYVSRLTEAIDFAFKLVLDVLTSFLDYIVYLPTYVGIAVLITTSIFLVRFLLFK